MRTPQEQFLHDLIIQEAQTRYARIHKEVHTNPGSEKNFEVQGFYPDIVFGGYGQVVQIIAVETTHSLSIDKASHWRALSGLGIPFAILVAKEYQRTLTDLLWKAGLMGKVKVATYDIVFTNL